MSRIFVTVGTDHHPFDRLITWLEEWHEVNPEHALVVQHGSSRPCATARNHVSMDPHDLQAAHRHADIVVGQVGPGTIADANAAGKRPLVVPRRPELGEVVDRHQIVYGELMLQESRVHLASDQPRFAALLDTLVADPALTAVDGDSADRAADAIARVTDVLTGLAGGRAPRRLTTAVTRVRLLRATSPRA